MVILTATLSMMVQAADIPADGGLVARLGSWSLTGMQDGLHPHALGVTVALVSAVVMIAVGRWTFPRNN